MIGESDSASNPPAPEGRGQVDELVQLVYGELKKIAHRQLVRERSDHTLNTTALVHETYLKVAKLDRIKWQNRAHFLATAAQAMRRVLIDYAVRRRAQKRGSGRAPVPLDTVVVLADQHSEKLLAIHEALERLEEINERQARIVAYRYFSGMTIAEIADALGVSPVTVKRSWTMARAWLHRELRR